MLKEFTEELDIQCLKAFPEMLEEYEREALENASSDGRYIFFEDYFNEFIEKHQANENILIRAAKFIEALARSNNNEVKNLVEVGILSGLVSREVHGIAKFLGAHSKQLLGKATSHTRVDRNVWWLDRKTVTKLG